MINAIFNLILNIVFFIIKLVFNLIMFIIPPFFSIDDFMQIISAFFSLLENAASFTYFIVGDLTPTFITAIITLFTLKHVVLPIVNFTRKVIIK